MTVAWFNKLICAFGITAVIGQIGSPAPPIPVDEQEEVQIEQYRGIRRVEPWTNKKPESQGQNQKTSADKEKEAPALPKAGPPPLPVITVPRTAEMRVPTIIPTQVPEKPLGVPEPKGDAKRGALTIKGEVAKEAIPAPTGDIILIQEAAVAPAPHSTETAPVATVPDSSNQEPSSKTFLKKIFIVAVGIVALLGCTFCFTWLLRRYGRHDVPLSRFEHAESPVVVMGPFKASVEAPEKVAEPAAVEWGHRLDDYQDDADFAGPIPTMEPPADPLGVGPTYEEERHMRENAAKQQEAAILQHLFEENLRLREQIEQAREQDEEIDPQS